MNIVEEKELKIRIINIIIIEEEEKFLHAYMCMYVCVRSITDRVNVKVGFEAYPEILL